MNNSTFLRAIEASFNCFLASGTSRSTAKLKPLHGAIACDISQRLGLDYAVSAQGWRNGKEADMHGRYYDKAVDITILHNKEAMAGIAVKFVMQNYSQNSNNYFENMLGETANIRAGNHPYFQIFIILDKLPYYNKAGQIVHWETFTRHNAAKYEMLSHDNAELFFHSPNKTLIYVVHIPENNLIATRSEYLDYYKCLPFKMTLSALRGVDFGPGIIVNDYERFIAKVYHAVLAL